MIPSLDTAVPIGQTLEAVAYAYKDQLPPEIYEQLVRPTTQLAHTIWNLVQLRPRREGEQLTMEGG